MPAKNTDYLGTKGSENGMYATCTKAGVLTGPWTPVGILKSSGFKDITDVEKLESESGAKYPVNGSREASFTMVCLQRSPADQELFSETLRNGYFTFIKELNEVALNSKRQYKVAPICKAVPNSEFDLPGGEIGYEANILKCPGAVTVDLSSTDLNNFEQTLSGSAALAKGDYTTLVELDAA